MSNLTTTTTTTNATSNTSSRLTACPQQKHQKPRVIWGFMLENTYFTEFDLPNHRIIEEAYQQRKTRQTSHYINIRDSHLPVQARVYFGVAQVHLRMPGTRYYVKRRIVPPSPPKHHQKHLQPNWSPSSSSSSTPMVTHQQQTPVWSSSSSSSTVTSTTSDNMMTIPHHHHHHCQATSPYLPTPSTSFAMNQQQQQQQCGDFGFYDWMAAATPQSMMLDHMTMTKQSPWQQGPIVDTSSFEPHLNENDTLVLNSPQFPWMSGDDFNTFGDMSFLSTPSVPF